MCDIYLILFVYENYVTSIKYPFSIIYNKTCIDIQGRLCTVLFHGRIGTASQFGHGIVQCTTDHEHLYRIYSIPTHDKHQWLLLQFIVLLKMEAKGVRNM